MRPLNVATDPLLSLRSGDLRPTSGNTILFTELLLTSSGIVGGKTGDSVAGDAGCPVCVEDRDSRSNLLEISRGFARSAVETIVLAITLSELGRVWFSVVQTYNVVNSCL